MMPIYPNLYTGTANSVIAFGIQTERQVREVQLVFLNA